MDRRDFTASVLASPAVALLPLSRPRDKAARDRRDTKNCRPIETAELRTLRSDRDGDDAICFSIVIGSVPFLAICLVCLAVMRRISR